MGIRTEASSSEPRLTQLVLLEEDVALHVGSHLTEHMILLMLSVATKRYCCLLVAGAHKRCRGLRIPLHYHVQLLQFSLSSEPLMHRNQPSWRLQCLTRFIASACFALVLFGFGVVLHANSASVCCGFVNVISRLNCQFSRIG